MTNKTEFMETTQGILSQFMCMVEDNCVPSPDKGDDVIDRTDLNITAMYQLAEAALDEVNVWLDKKETP